MATPAPGAPAEPSVAASPNPIPFGKKLTVEGRGWTATDACGRTVRLSLRSDQNAFSIGTDRVNPEGRFRFSWTPRRDEVGRGDWTLVARMRCPMRATTPIRIGARHLIVGRGRTSEARWTLLTRRSQRGSLCLGLGIRPLDGSLGLTGDHCGADLRGRPLTLGRRSDEGVGTFAYGMAARRVGRIEVTFGAGPPMEARILPGEPVLGFHGRFWIAPFADECESVSARAFDGEGRLLGRAGGRGGGC
jgi:hypothetical protein